MKRIHLFEFEDFEWFPNWIRTRMTRLIVVMHKILGTDEDLAKVVAKAMEHSEESKIIDLCSGSGGPMPDVVQILEEKYNHKNIELILTDLYPNLEMAEKINTDSNTKISYVTTPTDATNIGSNHKGLRTMICSMHHMKPAIAKQILKAAKEDHQPICIYEISDNSAPKFIWWIALPFSFIICLFVTPFVRPMSWQQLVFTYLIPIIPIFFAWDGAVSNVRTYTHEDMDILLEGLHSDDYIWEKGKVDGMAKKLYLLGLPVKPEA